VAEGVGVHVGVGEGVEDGVNVGVGGNVDVGVTRLGSVAVAAPIGSETCVCGGMSDSAILCFGVSVAGVACQTSRYSSTNRPTTADKRQSAAMRRTRSRNLILSTVLSLPPPDTVQGIQSGQIDLNGREYK